MCVAWRCMHLERKLRHMAAANPSPKGQHRQEFRMVHHRKKGFTMEPVEH